MVDFTIHPHRRFLNITGLRFGRLVVIAPTSRRSGSSIMWDCLCDCGQHKVASSSNLKRGTVSSCGCYMKEWNVRTKTTHGRKHTPEYRAWGSMMHRCENPHNRHYARYGGRGIVVCERWRKFEGFFEDMGERPTRRHSLDRIDNNRGYEKDNCKWSTKKEQSRNTCTNTRITHNGVTRCLVEWAEVARIHPDTLLTRLKHGWEMERAISTPVHPRKGVVAQYPKAAN